MYVDDVVLIIEWPVILQRPLFSPAEKQEWIYVHFFVQVLWTFFLRSYQTFLWDITTHYRIAFYSTSFGTESSLFVLLFLNQIRSLGDQTRCHCNHHQHLAARRIREFRANFTLAAPSQRAIVDDRGQGWQRVSNVCTWPLANLRRRVELY